MDQRIATAINVGLGAVSVSLGGYAYGTANKDYTRWVELLFLGVTGFYVMEALITFAFNLNIKPKVIERGFQFFSSALLVALGVYQIFATVELDVKQNTCNTQNGNDKGSSRDCHEYEMKLAAGGVAILNGIVYAFRHKTVRKNKNASKYPDSNMRPGPAPPQQTSQLQRPPSTTRQIPIQRPKNMGPPHFYSQSILNDNSSGHAVTNPQNSHPPIQYSKRSFQNPQPSFQNPQPSFQNHQPSFQNPQPSFQNHQPSFQNPQPSFQNHQPSFQNPQISFQNHQLSFQNHQPSFQNSTAASEDDLDSEIEVTEIIPRASAGARGRYGNNVNRQPSSKIHSTAVPPLRREFHIFRSSPKPTPGSSGYVDQYGPHNYT